MKTLSIYKTYIYIYIYIYIYFKVAFEMHLRVKDMQILQIRM